MLKKYLRCILAFFVLINFVMKYEVSAENTKRYVIVLETPSIIEQASVTPLGLDETFVAISEDNIAKEQSRIIDEISYINTEKVDVIDQLDTVLNCIVVESDNFNINEISKVSGIKEIYEDQAITLSPVPLDEKVLNMDSNSSASGALYYSSPYKVNGLNGENMLIAVIDGDFDTTHDVFAITTGTQTKLSESEAKELITENNLTGGYLNEKIPYYKENGVTISDHGTHVAGIVAGNNEYVQGTAPEAQLMLIEAADSNGVIWISNIQSGIEDAVDMGADCINISLGGNGATFPNGSIQVERNLKNAIVNANNVGVTVCHSAGNDGRDTAYGKYDNYNGSTRRKNIIYTTNPDYKRSGEFAADVELTVGSMMSQKNSYASVDVVSCNEYIPMCGADVCPDWYVNDRINSLAMRNSGLKIVNCGDGKTEFPDAVRGNIALVQVEYLSNQVATIAENAFTAGAEGVVYSVIIDESNANYYSIYKPFIGKSLPENKFVAGISAYKADLILKSLDSNGVSIIHDSQIYYDNKPSSYSSWGVTNDLKLVPSVSAYGESIISSISNNSYGRMSGTSMSSPHVSACVALVKQGLSDRGFEKSELNYIVKNLIMTTAELSRQPETGINNTSGVYHSPRQIGMGNINPQSAINARCIVKGSNELPKLDLGEISSTEINFNLALENISSIDAVYNITCETMTDGFELNPKFPQYVIKDEMVRINNTLILNENQYLTGNIVTVPANMTVNISGVIKLSKTDLEPFLNVFTNGFFVDGIIGFEAQNDSSGSDLNCAIMGFYGSWAKAPMIDPYIGTKDSYYNETAIYRADGWVAGSNAADVQQGINYDKMCVGEQFVFKYVPLRNIEKQLIYIDDNKILAKSPFLKFNNLPEYDNYGRFIVKLPETEFVTVQCTEEGEHNFYIYSKIANTTSPYQYYEIPYITDLTAPVVETSYADNNGEISVNISMSDNYYLQYVSCGDETIALDTDKGGATVSQLNIPEGETDVTIKVYDYANNMTELVVSTVIRNADGEEYKSLQEAIDASPDGESVLSVTNYCETLLETVVIPENKQITISGSAEFSKSDGFENPAVMVLGSLEFDNDIKGLDVSVIPKVNGYTANNGEISVSLSSNASNEFASVFAASYDKNGVMIDFVKLHGETLNPVFELKAGESYKIFVWNTETLIPYRDVSY